MCKEEWKKSIWNSTYRHKGLAITTAASPNTHIAVANRSLGKHKMSLVAYPGFPEELIDNYWLFPRISSLHCQPHTIVHIFLSELGIQDLHDINLPQCDTMVADYIRCRLKFVDLCCLVAFEHRRDGVFLVPTCTCHVGLVIF